MSLHRRIIFLVISFISITILTGYVSKVTSRPEFCANCHQIKPVVDSWAMGSHSSIGCLECHADPGILGQIKAKTEGVKDLAVQLAGSSSTNVMADIPPERCRRCHPAVYPANPDLVRIHQEPGANCGKCHKREIHKN